MGYLWKSVSIYGGGKFWEHREPVAAKSDECYWPEAGGTLLSEEGSLSKAFSVT
jgi:hypothetical protein